MKHVLVTAPPMVLRVERPSRRAPHWYFIYIESCVLCGRTIESRERRFTPRPERWEDRHELTEYACTSHFV